MWNLRFTPQERVARNKRMNKGEFASVNCFLQTNFPGGNIMETTIHSQDREGNHESVNHFTQQHKQQNFTTSQPIPTRPKKFS